MNEVSKIEEVFPAYPKYKDSGFEWIGKIPEPWDLPKVRYYMLLGRGRVISNQEIQENIGQYPVFSSQTKNNGEMGRINTFDFDGEYVTWTTDGANAGTVFYRSGKFNCTNVCGTLQSKNEGSLYMKFISYALSIQTKSYVRLDINPKLMNDVMANISFPLPPLSEQRQIAHFLDHKTAQIDAAIEKGRRLIELLREERAALINEAVTGGVDEHGRPRTRPTQLPAEGWKDSGVEWLGAVPEEWEVVKLKRIAEVRSGVTKSGAEKINDPVEIPYLRVANVQDGYLDLSNVSKIKIASRSIPNLLLQKGDLLMNEGGDNDKLGRGCIWNEEISPCTHQNHVFAVRPHPNINSKWLNAVTFTQYARNYFISNAKQSTNLASISSTSIKNLAIVLPSKIEQQRILRYIEAQTTRIDQEITTMEQEIELLTEYRQALISEAVTGKIDVRNITVDGGPNEGETD